MVSLSSLAKTILLNHIHRFHSCVPSSRGSRSPVGRPRRLSFPYILDRILFLLLNSIYMYITIVNIIFIIRNLFI